MIKVDSKPEFGVSDRDLVRRVAIYLTARGIADVNSLEIKACGGIVTLQGRVASMRERALCLNCCQRVAGVLHVIDELSVNVDVAPSQPVRRTSKSVDVPK